MVSVKIVLLDLTLNSDEAPYQILSVFYKLQIGFSASSMKHHSKTNGISFYLNILNGFRKGKHNYIILTPLNLTFI